MEKKIKVRCKKVASDLTSSVVSLGMKCFTGVSQSTSVTKRLFENQVSPLYLNHKTTCPLGFFLLQGDCRERFPGWHTCFPYYVLESLRQEA